MTTCLRDVCPCLPRSIFTSRRPIPNPSGLYDPLLDNERHAVSDILVLLNTDQDAVNFFYGDALRALSTLSYSDSIELQLSAALAFNEASEKLLVLSSSNSYDEEYGDPLAVSREALKPLLYLLQSEDVLTLRAATAALCTLSVNG